MPPVDHPSAGAGEAARKRVRVEALAVPSATAAGGAAALPHVVYLPSHGTTGAAAASSSGRDGDDGAAMSSKRPRYSVYAKASRVTGALPVAQLVHAAPDAGGVFYIGSTQSDEYAAVPPCSYALALYDRATGKLQLAPVAGGRVFRLEPRLPGLPYQKSGVGREAAGLSADERKMASARLVGTFGSTRRRRQLTAREEGIVRADKISGGVQVEALMAAAVAKGAAEGQTKDEVLRRAFAGRTIPPHDPLATKPRAAYPLELLLGLGGAGGDADGGASGGQLARRLNSKRLLEVAEDASKEAAAREKAKVPEYVLGRLGLLRHEPDKERRKATAQYLALLAALLRLLGKQYIRIGGAANAASGAGDGDSGGLDSVARNMGMHEELLEDLLARFYVHSEDAHGGVKYERTSGQSKLLQAYVLAVAVAAEDGLLGEHQFDGLRLLLKTDAAKLSEQMVQLGCSMRRVELKGVTPKTAAYAANLLRNPATPDKTLAECFPAFKITKAKSGR